MKNISNKILVFVIVGFLSISMILTMTLNFNLIINSLYENKEKLLDYNSTFSTVSSSFGENLIFIDKYANIYGGIQKVQTKGVWLNSEGNSYMVGPDGKIYPCAFFRNIDADAYNVTKSEREELEKCAKALSQFAKEVKTKNSKLFFVQAPARYNPTFVPMPLYVTASKSKAVDFLSELLEEDENINLFNTQSYFHEQNMNFGDWFYRTDTHWTSKTAFVAYQELCKRINSRTEISIEESFFEETNWNFQTFKNTFLGSYGKIVGEGFAGKDDIDIASPNFETDCRKISAKSPHVSIENGGGNIVIGTYNEAVLDKTRQSIDYGSYIGSDICEVRIENTKAATDKKILIIKDSFALPISAFLSTCFTETRLLDLRYFHDGVLSYLDAYKPDIVLVLYHPGDYNAGIFFNFQ